MHTSTQWTFGIITLGTLIGIVLMVTGWATMPPLPYLWHKALHLAGMTLLVGNIPVTSLWMLMAERSGEPKIMHFSARMVDWADAWIMAPGVVLLAINGLFMAGNHGGIYGTPWLISALVFFSLSGLLWGIFLIPLQHKIIALSQPSKTEKILPPEFFSALHRWYFWGTLATLTPLAGVFVMVLK